MLSFLISFTIPMIVVPLIVYVWNYLFPLTYDILQRKPLLLITRISIAVIVAVTLSIGVNYCLFS